MSSDSEDKPSLLSQALNFKWTDSRDRFWKVLDTYKVSSYDKLRSSKHQTEATIKYGYDYFIESLEPYRPRSWSSIQAFNSYRDRFLKDFKLAERVAMVVLLTSTVFLFSSGIRRRLLNTILAGGLSTVSMAPELINPLEKQ
jgi:hypothetical protein